MLQLAKHMVGPLNISIVNDVMDIRGYWCLHFF